MSITKIIIATLLFSTINTQVIAQNDIEKLTNKRQDTRYLDPVFKHLSKTANIEFAQKYNPFTQSNEKLTMRVFEPKGDDAKKRALLVLTPGGGFVQHDNLWMDDFGQDLAKAGYVVAIHQYRLSRGTANTDEFTDALFKAYSDQKSVISYFLSDAANKNRWRIDPNKVFIGGHSAGATTSMHHAYLDQNDDLPESFSQAFSKYKNNFTYQSPDLSQHFAHFSVKGVINLSGMLPDLNFIDAGQAAILSIHGENDSVLPVNKRWGIFGAIAINQKAKQQGIQSDIFVIKDGDHLISADPKRCPQCLPRIKSFMANIIESELRGHLPNKKTDTPEEPSM